MKKILISLGLLIFLGLSPLLGQSFAIFQTSGGSVQGWQKLLIGAGGTSTGIDIACDQGVGACNNSGTTTKVVRVDTHGAYVYGSNNCPKKFATCWNQIVTPTSMPANDPLNTVGGCINSVNGICIPYEVRIAPSNTNIAYMMLNGYMYVTTNLKSAAITWTNLSGFSRITTGWGGIGGSNARFWAPYMAIDPQNSNVVYVATPQSGVFYTTNGGTTWTPISTGTIPAGAATVDGGGQGGGNLLFFDPSDGTGNTVFVTSYGTGVYRCTSAATTPSCAETPTTNMPTTHINGAMSSGGKLYIVANNGSSDQTLYIYSGGGSGTWSTITVGTAFSQINSIAINPANNNNIVAVNTQGQMTYSSNGGTSFGRYVGGGNMSATATDIPWINSAQSQTYIDVKLIAYDPATSGTIYATAGFDVWTTTFTGGSSVAYVSVGAGLEQLVALRAATPLGSSSGNPFLTVADQQIFKITDPSLYPAASQHGTFQGGTVAGVAVDWPASSPNTVVCLCENIHAQGPENSAVFNGTSWSAFGAVPSGSPATYYGGDLAMGTSSVMVWVQSQNGQLYTTVNGASTSWVLPAISGVATSGDIGWSSHYYNNNAIVCADKTQTNTFYAYNYGGSSTAGIYKLAYNGSSWVTPLAYNAGLDNSNPYSKLVCDPFTVGTMYFTQGFHQPGPYPHSFVHLWQCTDRKPGYSATTATVSCRQVSNVQEATQISIGAKKPGSSFSSFYCLCWVNTGGGYVFGIWRSTDGIKTWTNLGTPNSLDGISVLEADKNIYGRVYVGYSGSGYAYGQFN